MNKQSGFTITELMVGLALSTILAFAVGTIFTQTRQSFRVQTAQTRLVEQGRYAIAVFQKMATQAGYRNETASVLIKGITDATGFDGTVINETAAATQFKFTGNATSAPTVIIKCDGSDYTSDAVLTNSLKKTGAKLVCNNGTDDVDLLSENVVSFLVTYGEDTTSDRIPDTYTTTPTFANVYAAKMCIVLKSDDESGSPQDMAQNYIDCAGTTQTATDRRLYRRFDTTVYLRNRFD